MDSSLLVSLRTGFKFDTSSATDESASGGLVDSAESG
jgi:hypothetical protein